MKYKITASEDGSLMGALSRELPVSSSRLKMLIKNKEAKINGIKTRENIAVRKGDEIEIFVPAAFLGEKPDIIYEDENILIADKPILTEVEGALRSQLAERRNYLRPLHRLDKNTRGLVVFALNEDAYNELYGAFKAHKVEKKYLALIKGKIEDGEYGAYLFKDEKNSVCYVSSKVKPGYKKIITDIKTVEQSGELSVVEVGLVTGRTHQIRAHLAFLKHPILGDGKYGDGMLNKRYGKTRQMLCAYKLVFHGLNGEMSYLNEKVFVSKQKLFD